ncbi:hypothetical protein UO65_0838 [Actinokineospora spheciospongiae]|uniref:Uncharacterized protein n=1 Tax=Actinokineospora spheciospongiae TaxID=909613 RepID=W7JCR8_9PSEU|nr:hypothetical protein UO65_0838 [Actinokineospora spheciospongiae]
MFPGEFAEHRGKVEGINGHVESVCVGRIELIGQGVATPWV